MSQGVVEVKLGVPVPRARRGLYVLIEEAEENEVVGVDSEGEVEEGRVCRAERVVEEADLRARVTRWMRCGKPMRASGEG